MRRVLFVDDEPKVLEGLENLLFDYMDEWDMQFIEGGQAAIERLAGECFDVIVTDMRMPGVDGPTLLRHVQEKYPHMARFVLSGEADLQAALRAMPPIQRFLSKPCDAATLTAALERAFTLKSLVNDDAVCALVGKLDNLPVRPALFSELTKACTSEDPAVCDIAAIVAQDMSIATKLLQTVNTAFFSRGHTIKTVQMAVSRLGIGMVKDIVLSIECVQQFARASAAGLAIERLNEHCFDVARVAKQLVLDRQCAEDAFLGGLVHDVGHLVLAATAPNEFRQVADEAEATQRPAHEVEKEVFGTTHAEVGAYLLGTWGLHEAVVEAVAHHHHPSRVDQASFDALGAVYVANVLVHEYRCRSRERGPDQQIDVAYLESLGVAEHLDDWRKATANIVEGAA